MPATTFPADVGRCDNPDDVLVIIVRIMLCDQERVYVKTRHIVERAVANSLCVGAYAPDEAGKDEQIGFARVISDSAT